MMKPTAAFLSRFIISCNQLSSYQRASVVLLSSFKTAVMNGFPRLQMYISKFYLREYTLYYSLKKQVTKTGFEKSIYFLYLCSPLKTKDIIYHLINIK